MHAVSGPDLTTQQIHDLLKLRVDIFVVEQACPYPEIDGRDLATDTTHLWIEGDSSTPITAALRILTDESEKRIGRVVTHADHRSGGLSTRLMEAALDVVGSVPIVLDAQAHLTEFYARFGFAADGPEFLEDGIPHVTMRRAASRPTHDPAHPEGVSL